MLTYIVGLTLRITVELDLSSDNIPSNSCRKDAATGGILDCDPLRIDLVECSD